MHSDYKSFRKINLCKLAYDSNLINKSWLINTENSWFSLTWWDGHVGVQNNGKMSLKFCIIIESNCQKNVFAIVLYTNMAAATSRENQELYVDRVSVDHNPTRGFSAGNPVSSLIKNLLMPAREHSR